ncbi:hypothetical protein DPMN_175836 [Dreissena polymorpha]|nr:hypothetical protein DPMN_175836 [Dreissena polymorpha]
MPGTSSGRKSKTIGIQTSDRRPPSAREKGVQVDTYPVYPDTTQKASITIARQKRSMFPK